MTTLHHGVAIRAHGGAIVTCALTDDGTRTITNIVRLPLDLSAVVAQVQAFADDPAASFIIDCEGPGAALRQTLRREHQRGWRWYDKHGAERQEITTDLLVAFHERTFHFAHALAEQEAMTRALQSWRRETREEGPDSELVVALRHALVGRPPAVPRIY
jgi:hypothetical protein